MPAFHATAPVLRMFDIAKSKAFYVDWLGFSWEWQHQFGEGMPTYAGLSLGNLQLHVSEHHGDGTPGSVFTEGLACGALGQGLSDEQTGAGPAALGAGDGGHGSGQQPPALC